MALIDVIKDRMRLKGIAEDDINEVIAPLKSVLGAQQYGLVWESQKEDVFDLLQNRLPFFEEKKGIINGENLHNHILIEGDNLYTLAAMQYTHRNLDVVKNMSGLVDVIYIDPPYNTGKSDFKYNDNYVNNEDQWRHSKWLSFMNKRLELAKTLLKQDGFICISIDENEQAQLKLLCDKIFGEDNRLSTHHIQVRYDNKSLNEANDWQPIMEYMLIYARNKSVFKANKPFESYSLDKFVFKIEELSKGEIFDVDGTRVEVFRNGEWKIKKEKIAQENLLKETWISGSIYANMSYGNVYRKIIAPRIEEDGNGSLYKVYGKGEDGLGYRYYTNPTKKNAKRGKMYSGIPLDRLEEIKNGQESIKFFPIVNYYDYSGDFGNIKNEGGVGFNSGKKPIKMIKEVINYHPNKNAVVLDFFAGSGSTGHAVLSLNKEDGGNRQFILCTNNEINYENEIEYFVKREFIQKEPKKNTNEHILWEKEVDSFFKSDKYKKIVRTKEYEQMGICQSVTMPRLKNIIDKKSGFKDKYPECNLRHYLIKDNVES